MSLRCGNILLRSLDKMFKEGKTLMACKGEQANLLQCTLYSGTGENITKSVGLKVALTFRSSVGSVSLWTCHAPASPTG